MSIRDIPDWAYDAAKILMESLKAVDPLTYYHCCRVGEMSRKLARDAGLDDYAQKVAEFSGLFHDVGKISVPQMVIHKPGKLSLEEFEMMKRHPETSEEIVRSIRHHQFFADLLPNIRGHHERLDGDGYPDKLVGDNIPLVARVILIVDTYDAMSQTRSYRKGLPQEIVYQELKRCAGSQFDSQLVKTFLEAHPHWNRQGNDADTDNLLIKKVA